MIRMYDICKSYQVGEENLPVLQHIDLEVKAGEFVAILGPSGSGKSTLMNIIGCMDKWDCGEYYLDNVPVHEKKSRALSQIRNEKIGFIFQKYQLISTYTAQQNIIMPLLARGFTHRQAVESSRQTVELLGLESRIKHKPRELSGGQQQRVAIARALVSEPAILLADEPTGALDSKTGKDVIRLFQKLHALGHTIVMITHDSGVAETATRILHIRDGVLSENGA